MLTARKIDPKGRLTLGKEYANTVVVVIKTANNDLLVKPAEVVLSHEAWLHKNETAFRAVREGIKQAKAGKFAKNPVDLADDCEWLDKVEA